MSGTRNDPFGTDLPPPLVPLPSCHARVKQLQARLFNGLPLTTSYIANCRLCLSRNFGDKSTTIIEEQLCAMLKQVFPFPITNQIGLPMNVCAECYKAVQVFYGYSVQVLANQKKLQETLIKTDHFEYNAFNKAILERAQHPDTHREQKAEPSCQQEAGIEIKSEDESQDDEYQCGMLIDADAQCKSEAGSDDDQAQDPLLPPASYERASLRSVRTERCRNPPTEVSVTHEASLPIGKTTTANASKSAAASVPSAKPPSLEFAGVRKRIRLSTTEPSETDDTADGSSFPKPVYICSLCAQTFDKHHQLVCHQKTHLMRECPICKQMIVHGTMREHIIKVHAVIDSDRSVT
ncbi:uncharacterized protein LOC118514214 isoform X1 [Anopheles stephensi]|uniref:uncharacterized protein LOC118514214 isoform X1 n=2 Tax=Anopheles stephensi TaxID=30069 RepID=UPI0016587F8D|nr:uncharacterized protein LOC118514214 isoform X1 [Anopheles stephensi]